MKVKVKIDQSSYDVEIEDINSRPVVAIIDGERYEVWPEETARPTGDAAPALKGTVPVTTAASATPLKAAADSLSVTAPLPGVIVSIDVKPGDNVKHGQTLVTLEAMKMKNAIRATRDGVVAEVHVANGDQVQHGQVLVSFKA